MKQTCLILILLVAALSNGFCQAPSKLLKDVNEVKVRNIGAIYNKNQIKGYFTFYDYDKADKKNTVYKLNLLDENLNDLGTTEIQGSKDLELVSSAFDGTNFCFKFWNANTKSYEMRVYNQEGKEVITNTLKREGGTPNSTASFNMLAEKDVSTGDGNGFVVYDANNTSFYISYIDGVTKRMWNTVYETDRKNKFVLPTQFLGANKDMVLTAVISLDKGMFAMTTHDFLIANDITTGKILFDVPTDFDDAHIVPINAYFSGDAIVLVGLNYSSAKTFSNTPEGLAFVTFDKTGKVISKNINSFENDLGKVIPMDGNKLKDGYGLYIHDVIRTYTNTNLVVTEKIKRVGTGGLGLENLVAIEYDNNFKVINVKEIPKEASSLSDISALPFMNAYNIANQAKYSGNMEYLYFQKNDDKKEITLSYVEFSGYIDNSSGSRRRMPKSFGQVKLKNGTYTTDKVPVKIDDFKKSEFTRILPAKTGYVLEVNYYKKEKQLSLDFIKLNN